MTGHKGSSEFCFPETLHVPRGEAEGNIEVEVVRVQSSRCCFPRASLSFDQWHVTRSPPIRKRELGGITIGLAQQVYMKSPYLTSSETQGQLVGS